MSETMARIRVVEKQIAQAAQGRPVRLLAVSKGQSPDRIREAYAAGLRDFGENYVQELQKKQQALKDLPDLRWHFIGHIQSNKIKALADVAAVHSLAEMRHAHALSELRRHAPVEVFLQVALEASAERSGVPVNEVVERYRQIGQLPGLRLVGLMTVLPLGSQTGIWFSQMKDLQKALMERGFGHVLLNMGMSQDFEEAIRSGADWVRIGSLVFGPRSV